MNTEERIEKLEKAISSVADKLESIQSLMTAGFEKIEKNFDTLKGDSDKNFNTVGTKLDSLREEITKIGDVTGYEEIHANLKRVK